MFVFRRHNLKSTTIRRKRQGEKRQRTLRDVIDVLDCESRKKYKQKNLVFQRWGPAASAGRVVGRKPCEGYGVYTTPK